MKIRDESGPAFPVSNGYEYKTGMTLRDWFAGMAMQGLLASGLAQKSGGYSRAAYEFADAMLEVRKK